MHYNFQNDRLLKKYFNLFFSSYEKAQYIFLVNQNVLDGLQMMLEDEKAALLRQLKEQVSGIDQERQRQLALVKLKMDKKKMEREEKYDSVALVLKLAKEADEKRTQK